jgi:hypothetical protein
MEMDQTSARSNVDDEAARTVSTSAPLLETLVSEEPFPFSDVEGGLGEGRLAAKKHKAFLTSSLPLEELRGRAER